MSEHQHRRRRHSRRSRRRRHRQWALWALAAMLVVGLLASRQWLAQQVALENAANSSPVSVSAPAQGPIPVEVPMVPEPPISDQPEMLPKPGASLSQGEVWRPGDPLRTETPADWTTPARYTAPDPALISALHEAGLRPEVLRRSGHLRVQRTWQGGRSQIAVVESAVSRFAGQSWRAVYAIAHRDPEHDPALALRLSAANAGSSVSGWSWDRGYWFAQARLPANARNDALVSAVEHVLISADDLEKELSGADEF